MNWLVKYLILKERRIPIIIYIIKIIKNRFKKNCYECKHYELYDVSSCGCSCIYKCQKYKRIDSPVSFNDNFHYEKCNCFFKESD